MRTIPAVEAKAHFSELLRAVEAGEEIVITRRGREIARLVPEQARSAASLFEPFWSSADESLTEPADTPPENVPTWE
jgi:prevent-host-death family protein